MRKFKVGSRVIYGEGGYEDYHEHEAIIRRIVDERDGGCYYLEGDEGDGIGYYSDIRHAPTKREILTEKIRRSYTRWKMTPEERQRKEALQNMTDSMIKTMMQATMKSPVLGLGGVLSKYKESEE